MSKGPKKCVYCPEGIGTTADHVPPRGFFPANPPANLITVPCCETCRAKDASNDEFMRNLFISFNLTERHPAIVEEISTKRNRSMEYAFKNAERLMNITLDSPEGFKAFDLKAPEVTRFFERVCRAVIYDGVGLPFFDADFAWSKDHHLLPPERQEIPKMFALAPPELRQKRVGTFFAYVISEGDTPYDFHIILSFYESFYAMGRFSPTNHAPEFPIL